MTMPTQAFTGRLARFVLPVTLSGRTRRDALIHTGIEPETSQTFVVANFTELDPDDRARLVDLWSAVNVDFEVDPEAEEYGAWRDGVTEARCNRYGWLQRDSDGRWSRYLPDTKGEAIELDAVFYATPGRTIRVIEKLEADLGPGNVAALQAMLAGAPLVDRLADGATLALGDVLDAFDDAFAIAQSLVDLVDDGAYFPQDIVVHNPFEIREEAIYLFPDLAEHPPNRPAAIMTQASPKAYAKAKQYLEQLAEASGAPVKEKIDRACSQWWSYLAGTSDETKVDLLVRAAVKNALTDIRGEQEIAGRLRAYEENRAIWIASYGSLRLKRAATRGYRHDGIYRDERLATELPGFVASLGRKPDVRELVNPSSEALEREEEVLRGASPLGIADDQVRLVYAVPDSDSDWAQGEFVQIERYLGRHTVWRSVSGETADDIPF